MRHKGDEASVGGKEGVVVRVLVLEPRFGLGGFSIEGHHELVRRVTDMMMRREGLAVRRPRVEVDPPAQSRQLPGFAASVRGLNPDFAGDGPTGRRVGDVFP